MEICRFHASTDLTSAHSRNAFLQPSSRRSRSRTTLKMQPEAEFLLEHIFGIKMIAGKLWFRSSDSAESSEASASAKGAMLKRFSVYWAVGSMLSVA